MEQFVIKIGILKVLCQAFTNRSELAFDEEYGELGLKYTYVEKFTLIPLDLNYNVKKINWNGMNIGDQIKEMAMADIVISLPGSDLMNCIFLNPKGNIICPNRFYKTGRKEDSNEINIWFQFTHNCIEISDVSLVRTCDHFYSKIII